MELRFLLSSFCLVVVTCDSIEKNLIKSLFSKYDPKVRPVKRNSTPVEVYVDYWFVSLLDVQEKGQILSAFGWMQMMWVDEFLRWDHKVNNITYIVVKAQDIWYPDLVVRNSATSMYGEIFDCKKYKVPVYSDGKACYIHLDSWTYTIKQLVFMTNAGVKIDLYRPNGQWMLMDVGSDKSHDEFNGDSYSEMKFVFYLKRKPLYYMTNLIIPCCLMSAIVLFVFLLPASADEKVSLSITVLLSFSVFQLLVAGSMPETSDYVPLIMVYITFVVFLSSLSLLSTIIVLMLHHHNYHSPPPKWLQKLALEWMAVIFCHQKFTSCSNVDKNKSLSLAHPSLQSRSGTVETLVVENDDDIISNGSNSNNNNNNNATVPKIVKEEISEQGPTLVACTSKQHFVGNKSGKGLEIPPFCRSASPIRWENQQDADLDGDSDSSEVRREKSNLSSVYDLVKISLARINTEKRRDKIRRQWAEVALVFDRFFLCVFLTVTLVVGVLLLGVLPQFGPNKVEPKAVS